MDSRQLETRALLYTAIASAGWGTSWLAGKIALAYLHPIWVLFLRFTFAIPVCLVILWVFLFRAGHGNELPISTRFIRQFKATMSEPLVIALGTINVFGFLFEVFGLSLTTAIKTSLLVNLNVVYVPLASRFVFKERFNLWKSLAIPFALIGMVLLITEGDVTVLLSGKVTGDVLATLAGLIWTWYILLSKRTTIVLKEAHPMAVTTTIFIITTLGFIPLALMHGVATQAPIALNNEAFIAILYLAIFPTAITYTFWYAGLRAISATVSTIILLAGMLVGIVLAYFLLGETLNLVGVLGAEIIILSVVLAVFHSGRAPRPQPSKG